MTETKKRKFEGLEQEFKKRRKLEITPTPEPLPEIITRAYKQDEVETPRFFSTKRPVMSSTLAGGKQENLKKLEGHLFLPVSRYSGLYYSGLPEENREFTGKFYFYEPDSPYVLDLGKTRVFGSKYHAYSTLKPDHRDKAKQKILDIMGWGYIKDLLHEQTTGTYPLSLSNERIIGPKEMKLLNKIFDQYYLSIVPNRHEIPKIPFIETTPLYPTDSAKLWSERNFKPGNHDFMDISLYKAAKNNGLDTIILQHEMGEFRAVTEILDTREDSEKHVYRLPPNLVPSIKYPLVDPKSDWDAQDWKDYQTEDYIDQETSKEKPDKYATIWFTDDGFLTLKNGKFEWTDK